MNDTEDRGYTVVIHEGAVETADQSGRSKGEAFTRAEQLRKQGKRVSVRHVVGANSNLVLRVDQDVY